MVEIEKYKISENVYLVSYGDAGKFIDLCNGCNFKILGMEGAWYYEDGAVYPVGDLIVADEGRKDYVSFIKSMASALSAPQEFYKSNLAPNGGDLKVEFVVA